MEHTLSRDVSSFDDLALDRLRQRRSATWGAGAIADPAEVPSLRDSVRDLEDPTAFGRSTVAETLGGLERAGLLAVVVRAGRTTRFTLRAAAFGLP